VREGEEGRRRRGGEELAQSSILIVDVVGSPLVSTLPMSLHCRCVPSMPTRTLNADAYPTLSIPISPRTWCG